MASGYSWYSTHRGYNKVMEFAPLVALGSLVFKFVDFLKFVRVGDWNAVGTQVIAWLAGILAVFLAAASTFAGKINVGGTILTNFTVADKIFFGLMATSIFSVVYDFKKSFDSTDSAKTPPLLTDNPPQVP